MFKVGLWCVCISMWSERNQKWSVTRKGKETKRKQWNSESKVHTISIYHSTASTINQPRQRMTKRRREGHENRERRKMKKNFMFFFVFGEGKIFPEAVLERGNFPSSPNMGEFTKKGTLPDKVFLFVLRKGKNISLKKSLRQDNIYWIFFFRGALGFICSYFIFRKFDFQDMFWTVFNEIGLCFPRKKRKTLISAEILPFRNNKKN